MEMTIAGLTAGVLTLFDLDRTFYVPASASGRARLAFWWWGFILANGLLAVGLYVSLATVEPFKGMEPIVRGLVIGIGYLALIRVKFTTFNFGGQDVPFGLEALYDAARGFVYKRINQIAKVARTTETLAYAAAHTLPALISEAKLSVDNDQVMNSDAKREAKAWIVKLVQDTATPDDEKRVALATFILSGYQAQ
jgi:hypothetical protein